MNLRIFHFLFRRENSENSKQSQRNNAIKSNLHEKWEWSFVQLKFNFALEFGTVVIAWLRKYLNKTYFSFGKLKKINSSFWLF